MDATRAIVAKRLTKEFRLGALQNEFPTLREAISRGARNAARRVATLGRNDAPGRKPGEIIRALDDVSFEVGVGEVVGIIGPNGAGKSTLLKIFSRVTEPTEGRAEVRGRLGSLLEVGTGFHLELTGRENVYLNGAILGMSRGEIQRKFDEIVAFSEVERFIDTPVKFYSSGMYLRLAFAVAAHLEPEVLLVDEVLAVGDAAFQQKCLGKMDEVSRHGRTILFVSHNMVAMQSLCDRVIWLESGRIKQDGPTEDVVSAYLRTFTVNVTARRWPEDGAAPGNENVRMRSASVRPSSGSTDGVITTETPLRLEFEYWQTDRGMRLVPSIQVINDQGILVFKAAPVDSAPWLERDSSGLVRDSCEIPGNLLNDGTHRIGFYLSRGSESAYWFEEILVFDVIDRGENREGWYGRWGGAVRPVLAWSTQVMRDASEFQRHSNAVL